LINVEVSENLRSNLNKKFCYSTDTIS